MIPFQLPIPVNRSTEEGAMEMEGVQIQNCAAETLRFDAAIKDAVSKGGSSPGTSAPVSAEPAKARSGPITNDSELPASILAMMAAILGGSAFRADEAPATQPSGGSSRLPVQADQHEALAAFEPMEPAAAVAVSALNSTLPPVDNPKPEVKSADQVLTAKTGAAKAVPVESPAGNDTPALAVLERAVLEPGTPTASMSNPMPADASPTDELLADESAAREVGPDAVDSPKRSGRSAEASIKPGPGNPKDGMGDANTNDSMKTATKVNKFASREEQKVPSRGPSLVSTGGEDDRELRVMPQLQPATGSTPERARFGLNALAVAQAPVGRFSDFDSVGTTTVPASSISPTQHLTLEISQQVVALKQFGADSMSLVVRPDAHTEILLRLAVKDGQVDVYARVDRGDSVSFKSHWGEMQQALSQQGVRLAPLAESLPRFSDHHPSSQSQSQFQSQSGLANPDGNDRRRQPALQTFEEPNLTGSFSEPVKRRAARSAGNRGGRWESWA